jgi:hypothetical protein
MQKLAGIITEGYTDAKRADNAHDLGKSGEENLYGAGVEKGEEIEKKKLTKEEAKKMIKDAILAEMSHDDDDPRDELADPHNLPGGQYLDEASLDAMDRMDSLVSQDAKTEFFKSISSFIRDLRMEGFEDDDIFDYIMDLVKTLPIMEGSDYDADREQDDEEVPMPMDDEGRPLGEAKKDKEEEEEVEIEDEETIEEPAAGEDMIDADMEGGMDMDAGSDEAKTAFDELTDAYRSAKELGDEKLIRQLANTITYFNKNIILK